MSTGIPSSLAREAEPDIIVCGAGAELVECEETIQRLGGCGVVRFSEEIIDPSSLPFGWSQWTSDDGVFTVFMDIGRHMDLDKEISKIEAKMAKVEKNKVKLKKTLKGKFQFRKSADEVTKKQSEYDEVLKQLAEQKQILQNLKCPSQ